jgi:hypothetical protein
MKRLLMLLWLLASPLPNAQAIDPGMAQGSLEVNQEIIALTQGYAHLHDNGEGLLDRPKELRILLTDREVPQESLRGIAVLPVHDLAKQGQVRGLLIRLNPKDHSSVLVTLLYPPANSRETFPTQTLRSSGQKLPIKLKISGNRVTGEIHHPAEGERDPIGLPKLNYTVKFSAPLFHELAITADLKGKAAQDSSQARLLREKARALAKGDFEAVHRLSTERANRQTQVFLAEVGSEARFFAEKAAADMERSIKLIRRVVVRGKRAVVIFSKTQWSNFVQEDGEWKSDD